MPEMLELVVLLSEFRGWLFLRECGGDRSEPEEDWREKSEWPSEESIEALRELTLLFPGTTWFPP